MGEGPGGVGAYDQKEIFYFKYVWVICFEGKVCQKILFRIRINTR